MLDRGTIGGILILLAVTGCRRDPYTDVYFEMLNAEKRVLEDRLNELEYRHEKALKELEACRTGGSGKHSAATGDSGRGGRESTDGRAPETSEDSDVPELDIFIPPLDPQTRRLPARDQFALASTAAGKTTADPSPAITIDPAPVPPDLTDRRITHVYLNPRVTRGEEFDAAPGDDGVSLLVEPRTADGQFVARAGPVSVVLLDPSREGEEARLGRWDFDEAEVRKRIQRGTLDRGFAFRIPWDQRPPQGARLQVHVRYVDDQGNPLDTSREIRVRLPGRVAQGWTPRTPADAGESEPDAKVVSYEQPETPRGDAGPGSTPAAPPPSQPQTEGQTDTQAEWDLRPLNPADGQAEPESATAAASPENAQAAGSEPASVPRADPPSGRFWKPYR